MAASRSRRKLAAFTVEGNRAGERPDLTDGAKQAILHDDVLRFYGR